MSDPTPGGRAHPTSMTPQGHSVIHDLGYRPYTGPRLGEASIARALIFTGFKNAFGLGRSAKSKVLPFILLGMNLFPAIILVGALTLFGADRLPIGYAQYASTTQVLLSIFVASQAPVLFSRDLRHGSITLYLARPLTASTYALSRWTSLLLASLVFVWLPLVIMYVGALLGELDFGEQSKEAAIAVFLGLVLALTLTGIGGLLASWSTRRGFAIVATIAVLLIGNGIVTALQGIAYEFASDETVGQLAGLFSPYSLYRGLAFAWGDANEPLSPLTSTTMEAAYLAVFLGLAAACLAGLLWRYRKLAGR
jgi:ABC-2 type transport system permease protein